MTELNPLPYASIDPSTKDQSHLQTLAICHYVLGGLEAAISSIFIIYVVIGILMARGDFPAGSASQAPPPSWAGYVMVGFGGCAVLLGWTMGILTILSGRWMTQHRRRTFSLVIAGISCASVPFGTLLGIFTFIVLARPSVTAMYEMTKQHRA